MIFWIYAIALLLLALAFLLIPIIRGTSGSSADQRQSQNIQIAREKKQILEQQLERGDFRRLCPLAFGPIEPLFHDHVVGEYALGVEGLETSRLLGEDHSQHLKIYALV